MHNPSIYLFTYKKNYLHSYQNICCQKRIYLRDDADLSIINFHEDFFKVNNDVLRVFFPTHSLWSVGHRFGQSHWEIQSSRASNDDVGFSGFSAFASYKNSFKCLVSGQDWGRSGFGYSHPGFGFSSMYPTSSLDRAAFGSIIHLTVIMLWL